MISENIKYFRKKKGMSQEEMAVKLHVVRQTVSKWEKGLSVPDADVLIKIAALLDVPVSKLLDVEEHQENIDLAEALAQANAELALKNQKEQLLRQAEQKRGLILLLSFLSMLIALSIQHEVVSILLSGGAMFTAVIILYRNLALLTSVTTEDLRLKALRATTVFSIVILLAVIAFSVLTAADLITFTENGEKMFAMAIIAAVMIFMGIISSKLPHSRHTGLRLPWTVRDKETWDVAHRILSIISLPIALVYIACCLTISQFEIVTGIAMMLWIGIPAVISYIYFRKKFGRK